MAMYVPKSNTRIGWLVSKKNSHFHHLIPIKNIKVGMRLGFYRLTSNSATLFKSKQYNYSILKLERRLAYFQRCLQNMGQHDSIFQLPRYSLDTFLTLFFHFILSLQ